MKKQKFNTGDIFSIPLSTGQYLFGRIVFDVYRQCNKPGVEVPKGTYFDFFAGCFLIEVYEQIAATPVYQPSPVLLPGVFTSPTFFKNGVWPIVAHQPINPQEVEFPEGFIGHESDILLTRGELVFRTDFTYEEYNQISIHSSIESPYGIGAMALNYLGRRDLIEERYLYDQYLENSDLRYSPQLRTNVYRKLGEDPTQSYYDLALKHGLDLARLY